jgi:hypothetical protein
VHHLDILDILAILLGIFWTVAKLDAVGRKAESFPHVSPLEFERWREWTSSLYRLGSGVCFLRVIFHQAWALYLGRQAVHGPAAPASLRYPALAMDLVFLATVALTFVRAHRARTLRDQLGIVLAPLSKQQAAAFSNEEEAAASAEQNEP